MTGYMQDAAQAMNENEELRKEIGRLRDALRCIKSRYEEGTIAHWKAKEALK